MSYEKKQRFPRASEYESSPNLSKLQMPRYKNNESRKTYQNCWNAGNMYLYLMKLQVGCLLLNIHSNIGMVTKTITKMRHERDLKSGFREN